MPTDDPLLPAFVAIADLPDGEQGPAVVSLVERFGVLSLCEPHRRTRYSLEHKDCKWLSPEPVSLWMTHARLAKAAFQILVSLEKGEDPDPYSARETLPLADTRGPDFVSAMELTIERHRPEGGWPEDFRDQLTAPPELWLHWFQLQHDVLRRAEKRIRNLVPADRDDQWWLRHVCSTINQGLIDFPTTVSVMFDPDASGITPYLSTSAGLLSRIYLHLAFEAAKAPGIAFCCGCGRPYTPQRQPKRGQDNFCPDCRSAHVPQRLHMRRRRAE